MTVVVYENIWKISLETKKMRTGKQAGGENVEKTRGFLVSMLKFSIVLWQYQRWQLSCVSKKQTHGKWNR